MTCGSAAAAWIAAASSARAMRGSPSGRLPAIRRQHQARLAVQAVQVRDLTVSRIRHGGRREDRSGFASADVGQEAGQPVSELTGGQQQRHQLGLGQRRRQEVRAGRFPSGRVIPVRREPAPGGIFDRGREPVVSGSRPGARPRQRPRQAERTVLVHAVPDRVGGSRQPAKKAASKGIRQRFEGGQPPAGRGGSGRVRVRRRQDRHLVHERERPSPAVGLLSPAIRSGDERRLELHRVGGELPVQGRGDLVGRHQARHGAQQPDEQPVHLNAGMPVVAAVEHRTAHRGPVREIARPGHRVKDAGGEFRPMLSMAIRA